MKYCSHCGNELLDEAVICPKCGCPCDENWNKKNSKVINPNASDKSRGMALLLCALLGGTRHSSFLCKENRDRCFMAFNFWPFWNWYHH